MAILFYSSAALDEYTKLLLHGDENPLIDSSPDGRSLTLYNSIARSAAQSKFGGYSISFNGTNQYIEAADSPDWHFDTNPFTIDLWVRFSDLSTRRSILCQRVDVNNEWALGWHPSDGIGFFQKWAPGGGYINNFWQGATTGWAIDTWYHLALERNGTSWTIYRDGNSVAADTDDSNIQDMAGPLGIGYQLNEGAVTYGYFYGYMDELRVSNGVARYQGSFTPENGPY